jgi:signal peptidase I
MPEAPSEQTTDTLARILRLLRCIVVELLTTAVPALLVTLFITVYVAEGAMVEQGPSMQPNLYVGYRVMTEKVSYRLHPPQRGDIVVVSRPDGQPALIKRVMALAGEVVEVHGGHTFIGGQAVEEPWVTHFGGPDYGPALVPVDRVFILGDNRAASRDSRAIGPVPVGSIRGRVWLIYWPLDQIRWVP